MNLATQCIDRQIAALQNLYTVIHTDSYKEILALVSQVAQNNYRNRVLMAGVGKNANIAAKIAETMMSLGIPAMPLNVSHLGHGDFGAIGPEDVIIHISRSGSTREMLEAMKHIKLIRQHVKQVLIHCKDKKAINLDADVELFIGAVAEGDEFGLAPTTSTTALLCILDTIAVQASSAAGFRRMDFLLFHPDGALGQMLSEERTKQQAKDVPTPGQEFQ